MPPTLPAIGSPLTAYATQMIVIGLIISLIAIPQVRRGFFSILDNVRIYFFGPEITSVEVAQVEEEKEDTIKPSASSRREMDEFDLSIFEDS